MASRELFSLKFNPAALSGIRYLENHVATMPNRIENIRITAVNSAARKLRTYLRNTYGTRGRGLVVTVVHTGRNVRIKVSAARGKKPSAGSTKGKDKENFAASVFLYGRKAFTAKRSPGQKAFKLREGSVGKYPRYLRSIKVKSMKRNDLARLHISMKMSSLLSSEIRDATVRQGFGVRGGNPNKLKDTPNITKSVAPNERVGFS